MRFVEHLVEPSDRGRAVVGVFARRIRVVHDTSETRSTTGRRPFQHLPVAVGIAESEHGPPADEFVDADRLTRSVVDEIGAALAHEYRLALGAQLELGGNGGSDHLL